MYIGRIKILNVFFFEIRNRVLCLFSEFEMKDFCLSVSNNSCGSSQNSNEDATIQSKPSKGQQNQRNSNQSHRCHRPPIMTDEEYSDSSGAGVYNDYVSN